MGHATTERRHPRIDVEIPVRIASIDAERDDATGRRFFRDSLETCANVSAGGALLVTPEPIAPGRRVLLELDLPGGASIQTVGRVAWSRRLHPPSGSDGPSRIGIEFVGAAPQHLSALEEFVARRSRRRRRRASRRRPTDATVRSA